MRLRVPRVRVSIGNKFKYQKDDGYLQSVEVTLGEQERASSCGVSVFDPKLKLLNLLLTEFQRVGGIIVPKGLLASQESQLSDSGSTSVGSSNGDPTGYLQALEQKYGASDLSGLTPIGRVCYNALSNPNVRAFLDAIAIAEIGSAAAAKGGYGYLYGDVNGETFDPKTLLTHPKRRRTEGGFTSSATGRYQTMDFVWDDDTLYGSRGLGLKDFKPISQEILAVGRLRYRGILEQVQQGEVEAALDGNGKPGNGASWEWASLEPTRYKGQSTPGGKKTTFIANFNRFRVPNGASPQPVAESPDAGGLPDAEKILKELKPSSASSSSSTIDVTQGIRIFIEIGFNDTELTAFDFLLTDIQGSDSIPHSTRIQGRQVRAIVAKSPKTFGVYRNTTIRQLANQVASSVGAKVAINDIADVDKVINVVRKNETDYQALLKAAKTAGLFVRGDAEIIKLEALKITDKVRIISKKVLLPGSSWGDTASDSRTLNTESEPTKKIEQTSTNSTNTLPSASADLANLKPVNLNKAGVLDINSAADEKKGIGKGFESELQILSILQPDILTWQPGEIVKPQTSFGSAIDREYRISQVKHSWATGVVSSSVSIYLPVAVVIGGSSSPTAGGAIASANAQGNPDFEKWSPESKKVAVKGDIINGFPITSGFGPRNTGIPGASRIHRGIDVGTPSNTPLYGICKAGESITVTYLPNQGSAGNMLRFDYGGYTFEYLHLNSGRSGTFDAGQVIAYSGATGVGSGAHLHFQMRKKGTDRDGLFAASTGWIHWCLSGKPPT